MTYIETSSGNRISREAVITGSDRILISGHTTVHPYAYLHGQVTLHDSLHPEDAQDLVPTISIGKYCYVDHHASLTPPAYPSEKHLHGTLKIGNYVVLGEYCAVEAASLGNRILVGARARLSNMCVVYDCCVIEPDTVVPPKCVVPPFSLVSGAGPTFKVKDLNGCYKEIIELEARELNVLG
ncbi:hypothetical protein BABINDRAFT_36041 [Babjeviella inositovora NRRL Y-12698]|uniref:Dynactin subunit 5 n=1 Tax=Babjeviella inositovora NRRL Y-12698 TaxID=984486 RepID=A0A1E3QPQ9_9ASCO|nr:uncharacterized protein BABINDRAFT_36041 [Babjeviella inositovora NRRL Y-12698]ODQ79696.1 hypothetical protein BABINDRAFT_36041 [Babjeviella inositovora NRRL Y-12698]